MLILVGKCHTVQRLNAIFLLCRWNVPFYCIVNACSIKLIFATVLEHFQRISTSIIML